MTSQKVAKQDLRRKIKKVLRSLTEQNVQNQSRNVCEALKLMPEYQRARRMSIYLPMAGREVSTKEIISDAFDHGKTIFAPYLHQFTISNQKEPTMIMDMLQVRSKDEVNTLKLDEWGIPTMSKDSVQERINCLGGTGTGQQDIRNNFDLIGLDMIIVPGVAFDMSFGRLGHGKGFYDCFLDKYQNSMNLTSLPMPDLVAIAFNEQILPKNETVPLDSTDWRMDAIITGNGEVLRPNSG